MDYDGDGGPGEDPETYRAMKISDTGYPGFRQAEKLQSEAAWIGIICGWCNNPYAGPQHDCYEKRNGIMMAHIDPVKVLETANRPAIWVERTGPNSATLEFREIPNEQAMRIVLDVLPKALELYLQKSKDYGGNVMDRFGLGQRAAIPDMARKFGKLIDNIWHGKPLAFEQADEILMDLLGHIMIILDQRRPMDDNNVGGVQ